MPIALLDRSLVLIDLRATGLLRGLAHDPVLTARPERISVELEAGDDGWATSAVFRVDAIEPPGDLSTGDRERMLENLRGAEVLDAAHFPTIALEGRYRGTLEGGTLAGEIVVRGAPRPMSMTVRVVREGGSLVASGAWEGRLTTLGIKPFKALLGALKLDDWTRLRLEARFAA
ncbi:MAG: YceI family protein [Polyangiaceae bacterium]|jgi:hypothetical protein